MRCINSYSPFSVHVYSVAQSCLTLCDPVDCTHQAPLSGEFSRKEYWSVVPLPTPGNVPNPGTEPMSLALVSDYFLRLEVKDVIKQFMYV